MDTLQARLDRLSPEKRELLLIKLQARRRDGAMGNGRDGRSRQWLAPAPVGGGTR